MKKRFYCSRQQDTGRKMHIMLLFLVVLALVASHVESISWSGGHMSVTAAIFGNNKDKHIKEGEEPPKPPIGTNPPPPPKGPPHLPTMLSKSLHLNDDIVADEGTITKTASISPPPPPPPKPSATTTNNNQQQSSTSYKPAAFRGSSEHYSDQDWLPSFQNPQQEGLGWEDAKQFIPSHPFYPEEGYAQNAWPSLEQQLEDSIHREHSLISQVQNLTTLIGNLKQQDQLHNRQMDVLTERIMDTEAQIAHERNRLLEYQTNCTNMGREIAALHQELSEWKSKCTNFIDQHKKGEARIKELKKSLKEARAEAENLAISIENSRIRERMDESRKKKSRGILGWMFSLLFPSSEDKLDDDDEQDPQDLAKSTLLKALQLERNGVDELEALVSSLQQNNSAIAEMVKSRDMIIDELNDRVAVFEEDKVVLKAALKQLQKEIKEEAPKAQKLIDELEDAREEIERLNDEIDAIIKAHELKVEALQQSIEELQNALSAKDSNLTIVGEYVVDKLEDTLASFATTRRMLEETEQKYKAAETEASQLKKERDNLLTTLKQVESEQNEMKTLLEELVQERTSLRQENGNLVKERDSLSEGAQRSRATLASRENDVKRLEQESLNWKARASELEKELNAARVAANQIEGGAQAAESERNNLKQQLEKEKAVNLDLKGAIDSKEKMLSDAKKQVETITSEMKMKASLVEEKQAELNESQRKMKELSSQLILREEELKTKVAELNKLRIQAQALNKLHDKANHSEAASKHETVSMMNSNSTLNQTKIKQNTTAGGQEPARKAGPPVGKISSYSNQNTGTKPVNTSSRRVPLRKVRKAFSKATGIHGAFTPPSEKSVRGRHHPRLPPILKVRPLGDSSNGLPLKKRVGPSPPVKKGAAPPLKHVQPPPLKPGERQNNIPKPPFPGQD